MTTPTSDNEAAVNIAKRFFESAKSFFSVKKPLSSGLGGSQSNTSKIYLLPYEWVERWVTIEALRDLHGGRAEAVGAPLIYDSLGKLQI